MIYFLHNGYHGFTHKKLVSRHRDEFRTLSCSRLIKKISIPRGTYVFTDRERMDPWELRVYARLYEHLQSAGPGYRVFNNPARACNRLELLRKLYREGINRFNVYSVSEEEMPVRYPVFIRRIFDHKHPLSGLIRDADELQTSLRNLRKQQEPAEGLIIVEYCAEPVMNDLFRKMSAYRIGETVFFYMSVHEKNWLVKYGTLNSATDELYREEYRMVQENAYADILREAFDLAHIEYGRADFGIVDGRVQVYEINTNPVIAPPINHPNPFRVKTMELAWANYLQTARALDTTDNHAPRAGRFRHEDVNNFFQRLYYGSLIRRR